MDHEMNSNCNQHHMQLRMLWYGKTNRVILGDILCAEWSKHKLTDKFVVCVKDGRSNLQTCTT